MQTSGAYARHLLHRSWDATSDVELLVTQIRATVSDMANA